jgi:hypothetical protein
MCVSRGSSTREQENPEVRGGVSIADQSGSIVSSHGPRHPATPTPRRLSTKATTHLEGNFWTPIEPLRSLYAGISSPWQSRLLPPQVAVRNIPPAILHPLQLIPPASFFVTHGTSSPSSTSHRQSCSSREFTFRLFFSTIKATPRFALIH